VKQTLIVVTIYLYNYPTWTLYSLASSHCWVTKVILLTSNMSKFMTRQLAFIEQNMFRQVYGKNHRIMVIKVSLRSHFLIFMNVSFTFCKTNTHCGVNRFITLRLLELCTVLFLLIAGSQKWFHWHQTCQNLWWLITGQLAIIEQNMFRQVYGKNHRITVIKVSLRSHFQFSWMCYLLFVKQILIVVSIGL
jgi:hypothetical protein